MNIFSVRISRWMILSFLFPVLLSGCVFSEINPCLNGKGSIVSEKRSLSGFKKIDLQISEEVVVTKGSSYEVKIETYENLISRIDTKVAGDSTLIISSRECINDRSEKTKIYITLPELSAVNLAGSGSVTSTDVFATSRMMLLVAGSGKIFLNCQASLVSTEVSGSGEIDVDGQASRFSATITGSGNIYAFDLPAVYAHVKIAGSGSCEVRASRELNAVISGSGNIFYKGTPSVNKNISGSGNVHDAN